MKRLQLAAVAAAAAIALATTALAATAPVTTAPVTAAPAKLNSSDHSFLADAMSDNQTQIDRSNYVAKQSGSDKVRKFAQTIVRERTQLAVEFQKANDGSLLPPVADTHPDPNLADRKADELDREYMDMLVADFDTARGKYEIATDAPQYSASVRDAAKKAVPVLRREDSAATALDHALYSQK